jgi:hypothetical protein
MEDLESITRAPVVGTLLLESNLGPDILMLTFRDSHRLHSECVQALMSLKEELEASSGMPASDEEWAEVAGISVNALQRQMAAGVEAKQRLVEVRVQNHCLKRLGKGTNNFWVEFLAL